MAKRYTRRILTHISDTRYRPRRLHELVRELGIDPDQEADFRAAVRELVEQGHVLLGDNEEVNLPPPGREMTGRFRLHPKGFGFLMPASLTQHGDLFIPPGDNMGALTGDTVRAKVFHMRGRAGGGRSPYVGKIVEILQRAENNYVGNLEKQGNQWLVRIDGGVLADPVVVRDPHAKNAREGDKVVLELVHYPKKNELAEGVITEVLGEQGEPHAETLGVLRAYSLDEKFPEQVMQDAREASQSFDDESVPPEREDLTGILTLTIDPPDARDFDDAISIRKFDSPEPDGAVYELAVHIADVAHFVKLGTELDAEAYRRGNSCYLPRRVVPMLPELLSNGVCSLQEGVNRFTKSAFMRYNADGHVVGERFSSSVIRSNKRMTYLEAQALIDDDLREARKHAKTEPKYPREVIAAVKTMNELAHTIRNRRFKQGMIVLNLPEVELVYDETGRVVDAVREDDAFTHKVIEMFMVEANEAVARLFDNLDISMIRRVHPDPPVHDVNELRQFARVAGYNIPANPSRDELQSLLEAVSGKPQQQAVHLAVLRTLSKAEYAPLLIGHFALASEHYTHFTSPIRRYPDLVIHRALDAYFDAWPDHRKQTLPRGKQLGKVARTMEGDERCPDEKRLGEIGQHCSSTERNAEQAERSLRTYFVLDLLEREHLGDDFQGTATGVASAGVFVQLDKYLVDGFVSVDDLPGGAQRWRLDRQTGALVAKETGRSITIGHRFVVRIAKVNPVLRKFELAIVSEPSLSRGGKKTSKKRRQPTGAKTATGQAHRVKKIRGADRKPRRRRR